MIMIVVKTMDFSVMNLAILSNKSKKKSKSFDVIEHFNKNSATIYSVGKANTHSFFSGRKRRDKYHMADPQTKQAAIDKSKEIGVKEAARLFNVPIKSLKRWLIVGSERQKGGGRKTKDPEMEVKLFKWYEQQKEKGLLVSSKDIKEMALKFSNCKDFLASKGWLDKFKTRFQLKLCN